MPLECRNGLYYSPSEYRNYMDMIALAQFCRLGANGCDWPDKVPECKLLFRLLRFLD